MILTLAMAAFVALGGENSSSNEAVQKIDTVVLRGNQIYPIRVRHELTMLHFPFRCSVNWVSQKGVMTFGLPDKGTGYMQVYTEPGTPLGTSVDTTLLCDPGLPITLKMTVAETEKTSPRIDFVWDDKEVSLYQQLHEKELADLKEEHKRELLDAADNRKTDIPYILASAKDAFSWSSRRDDGRNGSVIVHVDGEKRLGQLAIIEFRIVNRERGPVRVDRLEVTGVGSSSPPSTFYLSDDINDANSQSVGGVYLPTTLLRPGSTSAASVAFPWPGDTTRFKLVVHVTAPDSREVEVSKIDF